MKTSVKDMLTQLSGGSSPAVDQTTGTSPEFVEKLAGAVEYLHRHFGEVDFETQPAYQESDVEKTASAAPALAGRLRDSLLRKQASVQATRSGTVISGVLAKLAYAQTQAEASAPAYEGQYEEAQDESEQEEEAQAPALENTNEKEGDDGLNLADFLQEALDLGELPVSPEAEKPQAEISKVRNTAPTQEQAPALEALRAVLQRRFGGESHAH